MAAHLIRSMRAASDFIFRLETFPDEGNNARMQESATREIYAPLSKLAASSDFLVSSPIAVQNCQIERYIFEGPSGGGEPIRIGLFAGIHGDEQAGSRAIVDLAAELLRHPDIAEGYDLYM